MEKLDPPIQVRMSPSIYTYMSASLTEKENAEVTRTKDYTFRRR
jgi:hypothetical protein